MEGTNESHPTTWEAHLSRPEIRLSEDRQSRGLPQPRRLKLRERSDREEQFATLLTAASAAATKWPGRGLRGSARCQAVWPRGPVVLRTNLPPRPSPPALRRVQAPMPSEPKPSALVAALRGRVKRLPWPRPMCRRMAHVRAASRPISAPMRMRGLVSRATAELNPQPIQRLLSCRAVTRRVVQRAKPPRKSNPLSRASAFFFRPRHRRVAGRRRRAASSRRATEEAAAVHVVRGDAGQGGARGGQGQGGEGRQKGQGRRLG